MFRILICDDKIQDLEILRSGVQQWLDHNDRITGRIDTLRDSENLQQYLLKKKLDFDLYLLDIMLQGTDGIQLGKLIRKNNFNASIIYVTVSSEYALEAYENHAIRYLVKPVDLNELFSALDFAYAIFRMRPRHKLLVSDGDSMTSIVMEEIMYIENNLRTMTYTICNGNEVVSVRRGGSFEEAVGSVAQDKGFIQPHKSFFVNMRYIQSLQSNVLIMENGKEIPIARRRLLEIQDRYISFVSKEGRKSW
ncbi:MAG: LytTR family DNA-binding domain-containing protein [Eubacteriales bacterium]|nr:LytTR family DNA-binding domain-containing protein [Eubacteriales bacterium]